MCGSCKYQKKLAITGLVLYLASSVFAYSGGTGEPNSPYQIGIIADWNDLMTTSDDWDKHFIMIADVNLQGVVLTPVGNPTKNFTGVFDGNDNIIRNAVIYQPSSNYVGLFGYTGSGSQIHNLGVADVNIAGKNYVGGLIGQNYQGNITNCYTAGTVTGYINNGGYVGGLVGWNNEGTVNNCYSASTVAGYTHVGGLVGYSVAGNITGCHATGTITGHERIGGLVGIDGYAEGGGGPGSPPSIITNCYATGTVIGNGTSGAGQIGGLVGASANSTITGCHASGEISGNRSVGGLVGSIGARDVAIINCYATGAVNGTSGQIGGLVGLVSCANSSNIRNCYSTGDVSGGTDWVGGLVGQDYSNASINNCYSVGSVTGTTMVGGFIGKAGTDSITNCYSVGSVIGSDKVGGFVGECYTGCSISSCYSTGSVSGTSNVGGLVGINTGGSILGSFWDTQTSGWTTSGGGAGKTTAEMKNINTFIGWNFTTPIWKICNGGNYPKLAWQQLLAGDFVNPDGVGYYDLAYFTDQWLFEKLSYDIFSGSGDGVVNFRDFAVFANTWQGDKVQLAELASQWLKPSICCVDIAPAGGDGIVNFADFAALAENWLKGT